MGAETRRRSSALRGHIIMRVYLKLQYSKQFVCNVLVRPNSLPFPTRFAIICLAVESVKLDFIASHPGPMEVFLAPLF